MKMLSESKHSAKDTSYQRVFLSITEYQSINLFVHMTSLFVSLALGFYNDYLGIAIIVSMVMFFVNARRIVYSCLDKDLRKVLDQYPDML